MTREEEEFVTQIKLLQSKYPTKLRVIRSESELKSIDIYKAMEDGMPEIIEIGSGLVKYISGQLATGKEVAFQGGARKGEFIVYAAKRFFR